jgi:hypothetical protein
MAGRRVAGPTGVAVPAPLERQPVWFAGSRSIGGLARGFRARVVAGQARTRQG